MEEGKKIDQKILFISRIKRIIEVLLCIPVFIFILPFIIISLSILGLTHNFYILLTKKKSYKLSKVINSIQSFTYTLILFVFFLGDSLSEFRMVDLQTDEEDLTKRLSVLIRLIALPLYLFAIGFYSLLQVFSWLPLLLNQIEGRKNPKFEEEIRNSFQDIYNKINYLTGMIEKPLQSRWLDDFILGVFFVILLDYLISQGYAYSLRGDSELIQTIINFSFIIIFILVYLIMIPKFLQFPTINSEKGEKKIRNFLGVNKSKNFIKDFSFAFGVTTLLIVLLYGIYLLILYDNFSNGYFKTNVKYLHFYISKGLFAGITEEIIYRGFIITLFRKRFSISKSIIFSSIIFGLIHFLFAIPNSLDSWETAVAFIVQAVYATFAGISLGLFFVVSNSLLGPIIIHSLYDIIVYFVGFQDVSIVLYEDVLLMITPIITTFLVMIFSIYSLRKLYNRSELFQIRKKNRETIQNKEIVL